MQANKNASDELLQLAQEIHSKAIQSGNDEVAQSAKKLLESVEGYHNGKARVSTIHEAYRSLLAVLGNKELWKIFLIELIVKLTVDFFLHLQYLHG